MMAPQNTACAAGRAAGGVPPGGLQAVAAELLP